MLQFRGKLEWSAKSRVHQSDRKGSQARGGYVNLFFAVE